MAALIAELRVMSAGVRKDLRAAARYPAGILSMSVVSPLFGLVLPALLFSSTFLVGGRAVGLQASTGTANLVGFIFSGGFVNVVAVGTFWGLAFIMLVERGSGTFEQCWLTPARRLTFMLQYTVSGIAVSVVGGIILVSLGSALFGVRYATTAGYAVPMLLIAFLGLVGVGTVVVSVLLLVRQADLLINVGSFLFALVTGAMFPISILPTGLRELSLALPTTFATDALRHYSLGTTLYLPVKTEYLLCAASSALWLALGTYVFARAERRLTTTGGAAQH